MYWADSPFPLIATPFGPHDVSKEHSSCVIAQNMAHIHNCLLRCLNAIYVQAPNVSSPQDIKDLLQLVSLWHDEIEHHHSTEEEIFFPDVEKLTGQKGIMEGNVEQHHLFEPGMAALKKYATQTTVEEYDATKLQAVIDSFGDILQQHLNDEIQTLLSLKIYDSKKLQACWDRTHEHVLKTCNQKVQLPILLGSFDVNFEGKATPPSFPWFLPYLVHYWFARQYNASWRFLPCNFWGHPRALPFSPKVKA